MEALDASEAKCEKCGIIFNSRMALEIHQHEFHASSPYRATTEQSDHVAASAHLGSPEATKSSAKSLTPSHPCPICGITFTRHDSMMEHRVGKHEKKLFVCPCGKTMQWRRSLYRHRNKCLVAQLAANYQELDSTDNATNWHGIGEDTADAASDTHTQM